MLSDLGVYRTAFRSPPISRALSNGQFSSSAFTAPELCLDSVVRSIHSVSPGEHHERRTMARQSGLSASVAQHARSVGEAKVVEEPVLTGGVHVDAEGERAVLRHQGLP